MAFVSVTRLRVRALRFMPAFAVTTFRTLRQVKRADGLVAGSLLAESGLTFWTMTVWRDADSMRGYMTSGPHRAAMPRLAGWCDEASIAHWEQPEVSLPSWPDAGRRMRETGRTSRVRYPSGDHDSLRFAPPRGRVPLPIRPRRG